MPIGRVCFKLYDAVTIKKAFTITQNTPGGEGKGMAWIQRHSFSETLSGGDMMFKIDQANSSSMKFASVVLLVVEILKRAHQQLSLPTELHRS